jgi:hypothetical protein
MSLQKLRKEIQELKEALITRFEPLCKIFILGVKDSPTEADIGAYAQAHPHTHIVKLIRKNCRKA